MIPNEQPVPYTPCVNVNFPVTFDPRSNIFANWEMTRDEERTIIEIEAHVYKTPEGPKELPETVQAAALLRIRDKLTKKEYFLCFEADDVELLAFDNESLMARLREFLDVKEKEPLYITIGHLIYDQGIEADSEPVVSLGYFNAILKEYLEIDLLDASTMDVIKPIYGAPVPNALNDSI